MVDTFFPFVMLDFRVKVDELTQNKAWGYAVVVRYTKVLLIYNYIPETSTSEFEHPM